MQFPRRAALLLSAALLSFLLPVSSFSFVRVPSRSVSDNWVSFSSLSTRPRQFAVTSNADGIPQLEPGENPAKDPENIFDKPVPSQNKVLKNTHQPAPESTAEVQGDVPDPLVPNDQEPENHPSPAPLAQPSAPPEYPDSDGNPGPEAAATVQPPPQDGQSSVQPNSQELLAGEETPEAPAESPEALDELPPTSPKQSAPPPPPSTTPSSVAPTKPSSKPAESAEPSASRSAFPLPSTINVGVDSKPVTPSVSTVASVSPKPPTAVVMPSSDAPEVTDTPGPEAPPDAPSGSPSPSMSSSLAPPASQSSSEVPSGSDSQSPSTLPEPEAVGVEEGLLSPEASSEPTAVADSESPSASPWNITTGNVEVTAIPPPGSTVAPSTVPALPPSASATPETAATAILPPPPVPSTSTSPATPGDTVVAVPPPPAPTPQPPPPTSSPVASASPSSAAQSAGITAVPPPPPSEPDATAVVPVPLESPSSNLPTVTPSTVPPAESPVLPSPSATATFTAVLSPPPPSSQSPDVENVPEAPSSADQAGFICLYFGTGSPPGFFAPDPSLLSGETAQFSVSQNQFPSLAPQYLSHIHGESWSYDVPVEKGSAYDFVLAFAEVYNVACASGPDAGFRTFEVAIGSQNAIIDIMAEVGCGKALKKTFNGVPAESDFLTVAFQGLSQQAILNTMCYRNAENINQTPKQSPNSLPAVSSSPGATTDVPEDIVVPDQSYQCVNFGPKVVGGYLPYDQDAISGTTFLYKGSGVDQNPELPVPYRYHLYGKEWSYSLDVSSSADQKIVLGFAEVYPKACASGSSGAFRVFTITISGGVQIVDAMKSVGCGVVEQVSFESVSPQNGIIDISFFSLSGNAMLSVLCFKDASPPSPVESGDPVPTTVPVMESPSSNPSPNPPNQSNDPEAPGSPIYESCFQFGDEIVDGFANADLGSGVELYTNPFAIVQGTKYNSVYSSHVFGPKFTFSVQTSNTVTKSVILGFAEVFQPACKEGYRVFDVQAGSSVQTIDVYKEVGCNTAFDLRIDGLIPSSSGIVEISFSSVNDSAMLSAVCIMDEGSSKVSNVLPSEIAGSSDGTTSSNGMGHVLSAQVSSGDSSSTTTPSLSPSDSAPQSSEPSPSPTPEKSTLPKENGVIISLPTDTPEPSQESILVDLGLTLEESGYVPTPTPSAVLLESNFSSTTMGEAGESQSPDASPLATVTPSQLSVMAGSPGVSPSSLLEPTKTPFVSFSAAVSVTPPITSTEITPSSSPQLEATSAPGTGTADAEISPTITPTVNAGGQTNPSVAVTAIPPVTDSSGATSPSVSAISSPVDSTVPPSQEPIPSASVSAFVGSGFGSDMGPLSSVVPSSSSMAIDSTSPIAEGAGDGTSEAVGNSSEDSESSEPLVTAVPPDTQSTASEDPYPTAVVPSGDSSNGPELGGSTQSNQGVIVVPQTVSPGVSPSVATLVPSPVGPPVVEVLPPVDDTPLPSVIPSPSSPSSAPFPTVTSGPSTSAVASVSPVSDGDVQVGESESEGSVAPTPAATDDSPVGVIPGSSGAPTTSPVASANQSRSPTSPESSPSATPSQIVSTTGTDEVITVSSVAPSPDPRESVAVVAPPKPVSSAPDNGTGIIEVTDGSAVSDDAENQDASETIVAGEFKELISRQSEGNGFTIGMGVLGALLVLLLVICLFFAIFRSRGGAYSYSSQYSAHKPTDYGDPSQGGYTEELAPGTGEYGNAYTYGQGAQDGYGDGPGTFESRAQTQNGSFTYEGAEDGLGGGSAYDDDVAAEGIGGTGRSTYANTEPDTFAEDSSLNMHRPLGYGEPQEAHTGEYTFTDTFTIPNTGDYPAETSGMAYDEYQDPGPATTEPAERTPLRTSDSFNIYHSVARPITQQSESSGKQGRNMVARGSPRANDRRNPMNADGRPVGEASIGTSEGTRHSDVRDSSQRILSISSNPSAAQSPYERNIEVPVGEDHSGNVYEDNPMNLRTQSTVRTQATVSRRVLLHERTAISRDGTDTEAGDDFLCNDYSAPQTGTIENSDEQWGTLLTHEASAIRSQVSDDGPWPSWWSDRKKLAPAPRVHDTKEQMFEAQSTAREDYDGDTGENETLSSTGVTRSLFQQYSQLHSPGASDRVEHRAPTKAVAPLAPSSKTNVMPLASSHILPDSGWRRMSTEVKTAGVDNENVTVNDDFEELRRRREPYVKSVASRLSIGLQSISTSLSGESALEIARKDHGEQQKVKLSGVGRTSSSWIIHGVVGT